jgi:26S proteasome regulatory subunit T6
MATNRIDILDPALLRPGRIDRKIEFPPPNEEARLDILKIHSRKMNLTRGINLRKIAELMPGASGAEVKVTKRPFSTTTTVTITTISSTHPAVYML